MRIHVLYETPFMCITMSTLVADESLLDHVMRHQMSAQRAPAVVGFITCVAFVRLLSCVFIHVVEQVVLQ